MNEKKSTQKMPFRNFFLLYVASFFLSRFQSNHISKKQRPISSAASRETAEKETDVRRVWLGEGVESQPSRQLD